MLKTKNKKGLSLIEFIVVIAIIGIMTSISIVALSDSRRNYEVETAAEQVVAAIREVQNYSLTGKEISLGCATYSFRGIGPNYIIYNGAAPGSCSINQTYRLNNGVVFSSGGGTITFTAPHGDVSVASLRVNKDGRFYTICINQAGLIRRFPGSVICP